MSTSRSVRSTRGDIYCGEANLAVLTHYKGVRGRNGGYERPLVPRAERTTRCMDLTAMVGNRPTLVPRAPEDDVLTHVGSIVQSEKRARPESRRRERGGGGVWRCERCRQDHLSDAGKRVMYPHDAWQYFWSQEFIFSIIPCLRSVKRKMGTTSLIIMSMKVDVTPGRIWRGNWR